MTLLHVLQVALACLLAIDAFRRLLKVGPGTVAPIRHAFALLFAAALYVAGATIAGTISANWPTALLLLAILAVQMSTSRYWRAGVPRQFTQDTP